MRLPNVNLPLHKLKLEVGGYVATNTEENMPTLQAEAEDNFYKIVDKDSIEVIDSYYDRCPLLELRKAIMRFRVYIVRGASATIMHPIFDSISIAVIIANTMTLTMEDPTSNEQSPFFELSDYVFQGLYTIEMFFKICGMGFICSKGSYLRDSWNILDFIIVVSGYVGYILGGAGVDLGVLRSFRVLRPLRTISGIEGLRIIVSALVSSLPLLRDTILVLLFFFIIFAIAGVQMFGGVLKKRCINIETGIRHFDDDFCGG